MLDARDVDVLVDGLAFAEGPRWHDGALFLSDMHTRRVLRVEADGTSTTVLEHTSPVSGLGWLSDGSLLAVAMEGDLLRAGPAGVVIHADLRPLAAHGVNDMVSHPGGWSYVGQFGYDRHAGSRPAPSALLVVSEHGHVSVAAEGLLVANGMAIPPDGATLLVAESAGGRISSYTVDDAGELGARGTWAALPAGYAPDGMCSVVGADRYATSAAPFWPIGCSRMPARSGSPRPDRLRSSHERLGLAAVHVHLPRPLRRLCCSRNRTI